MNFHVPFWLVCRWLIFPRGPHLEAGRALRLSCTQRGRSFVRSFARSPPTPANACRDLEIRGLVAAG